jgi:hypothetical protein
VVPSFHQRCKAEKIRFFILVPDGHYSHTRNLEVITLAQENHVIICLLLHNSHKMQPLDKAFFEPLVTFYSQEI